MAKNQAHAVVSAIKELAVKLGRAPTRDEFRDAAHMEAGMRKAFNNSYAVALKAAGFEEDGLKRAGDRKHKKFHFTVQKLQGFFVHDPGLKELFERAGNPDILKMVAIPDTHVPFHDRAAVNAVIDFLCYYKPDALTIMGDFPDCAGISHWPATDLQPRRLVPELLETRKVLRELQSATQDCTSRFYLTGNHEDWIEQAKVAKLPELFDGITELLPEGVDLGLKTFLQLDELGYELMPLNHLLQIGKAYFTHGLYTNEHHPKKHLETFGKNIYYGHLHDIKGYNRMSIDGPIEAQSLGCLCKLDAKFMRGRPNNWVHALGIYEFFPDGTYTFLKPCIFDGRFSFNGKLFDGNLK